MIASTVVRAHHCAVGLKRDQESKGFGRSRGGFTTKALLSLSKGCTPDAMLGGDRYVSS